MFEKFSESARRDVIVARFEASRLHFDRIEAQHFILAFLSEQFPSEDKKRQTESLLDSETAAKLRTQFESDGTLTEVEPKTVDLPLSNKARAAISAGFNHAGGSDVTPLHLMWGVLDVDDRIAGILSEHGVTKDQVEKAIRSINSN